jgi:Bromodomain
MTNESRLFPTIFIGLTDYPILISNPMDLGTVKKKIKNKEYTSFLQCGEDVKLIWNNCMTYNADGSDFYKLAQSLYKRWDAQYSKFLNDIGAKEAVTSGGNQVLSATSSSTVPTGNTGSGTQPQHAMDRKVTLQEKRNLAKSFYQISKEDLGKVLIEIEKRTPEAITRNASEDELALCMDEIDVPTMEYINNMVAGYVFNCLRISNSLSTRNYS